MATKILKSRYYLVNPWKKKIITKKFDSSPQARQYKKPGKNLQDTFVAIKGSKVQSLMKKYKFKKQTR